MSNKKGLTYKEDSLREDSVIIEQNEGEVA
jgi:hypothetical protein